MESRRVSQSWSLRSRHVPRAEEISCGRRERLAVEVSLVRSAPVKARMRAPMIVELDYTTPTNSANARSCIRFIREVIAELGVVATDCLPFEIAVFTAR